METKEMIEWPASKVKSVFEKKKVLLSMCQMFLTSSLHNEKTTAPLNLTFVGKQTDVLPNMASVLVSSSIVSPLF